MGDGGDDLISDLQQAMVDLNSQVHVTDADKINNTLLRMALLIDYRLKGIERALSEK